MSGLAALRARPDAPIEVLLLLPHSLLKSAQGAVRQLMSMVGREFEVLIVQSSKSTRRFRVS
tara:strand:- start:18 stop:203 length:186 start_codon:yes stop_codon:yes gene_type:complete